MRLFKPHIMDHCTSPRNVRIANLQNYGSHQIQCPYPGCVSTFVRPSGLRKHARTGKHNIPSLPAPIPTSPRILQRFKPTLTVETPGKTPRPQKTANRPPPLYSDSEGSDDGSHAQDDIVLSPLEFNVESLSPFPPVDSSSFLFPTSSHSNPFDNHPATSSAFPSSSDNLSSLSSRASPSSLSSSSSSESHQMDSEDTTSSNHMEIDTGSGTPILDATMWSPEHPIRRDQLQEDTSDSDGVPISRVYHPILDGMKFVLIRSTFFNN